MKTATLSLSRTVVADTRAATGRMYCAAARRAMDLLSPLDTQTARVAQDKMVEAGTLLHDGESIGSNGSEHLGGRPRETLGCGKNVAQ